MRRMVEILGAMKSAVVVVLRIMGKIPLGGQCHYDYQDPEAKFFFFFYRFRFEGSQAIEHNLGGSAKQDNK